MHWRFSLLMACFVFSILLLFGLTSWLSPPTHARQSAEITVDTLEDEVNSDGDCSLREAITAANVNLPVDACPAGDGVLTDTIAFAVNGVITLGQELSVTAGGPLSIDGGEVITVTGNGNSRVFLVNQNSFLSLMNLALVDGWVSVGGGAIHNSGAMILTNSIITGSVAYQGGGIYNSLGAKLVIINGEISNNLAHCAWAACNGGGIYNAGILTVTTSEIHENLSYNIGGGVFNNGVLTVSNTTLYSNTAWTSGSGIGNQGIMSVSRSTFTMNLGGKGEGIRNTGLLTVTNSTFNGNSWGIINGNTTGGDGKSFVYNSTFYSDPPDERGGIQNYPNYEVWVFNSIVAKHLVNCLGLIYDGGHNLDSKNTCGFDPSKGSLINTDPLLGPLQDNGGGTWTHALLAGSPAMDAGDDGTCPSIDQRGIARPQDGDGNGVAKCDIGSFEKRYPYSEHIFLPLIMKIQNSDGSRQ